MWWKDVDGKEYDIIPKADLIIGDYYVGFSRDGHVARWTKDGFVCTYLDFGGWATRFNPYPTDESKYEVFRPFYRIGLDFSGKIR